MCAGNGHLLRVGQFIIARRHTYLLNRAGYHSRHVPHGWRATFSTIMNERHRDDRHIIDLILAHAPKDKTEAAYNRAAHIGRRRELLQQWADLLLADAAASTVPETARLRWAETTAS